MGRAESRSDNQRGSRRIPRGPRSQAATPPGKSKSRSKGVSRVERVVVAGGGTAGHVHPGLALAEELSRRGIETCFIGSARGPERDLVSRRGFAFRAIEVAGLERRLGWGTLVAGGKLVAASGRSLTMLASIDPQVVVTTGGYVSLPVALAARIRRIPLIVHEQNRLLGLANRLAARFADIIAVSFPDSEARWGPRALLVGNPVRPEIGRLEAASGRVSASDHFRLDPGRRTLLIVGGSQGARTINEAALGAYDRWRHDERLQVLHLAGRRKLEETESLLRALRRPDDGILWRVAGYTDRMDLAYAASDLALCRSGASTIAELAAVGLPAILVPYPFATADHQRANAEAVAAGGGAQVVLDAGLSSEVVAETVAALIFDDHRLAQMAKAMSMLARADAAERLADAVLKVASAAPVPPGRPDTSEDPEHR